jgi:hypothetical protein
MVLAGCGQATDPNGTGMSKNALTGSWVSIGSDVAPLLAGKPFNYTNISVVFNADSTYKVEAIDSANKTTEFDGTFTTMTTSVSGIVNIKLNQTVPTPTLAEGMFQIDTTVTPARMQYEVVQTQPTNGLTPPIPEKGFGSTIFNGMQIATLIQKYSRQ